MVDDPHVPSRRGLFIVVEGIDGAGTTTQGQDLADELTTAGFPSLFTKEPSAGPAGAFIRLYLSGRIVAHPTFIDAEGLTESGLPSHDDEVLALLFAADRMDHAATDIEPALRSGRHVISDRYILSSLAYQGLTLDPGWLWEVNKHAPKPDITFFLNVQVATSRARMSATRLSQDIFEGESQLGRVREQYFAMMKRFEAELGPMVLVDSEREKGIVLRNIRERVAALLDERGFKPRSDVQPVNRSIDLTKRGMKRR